MGTSSSTVVHLCTISPALAKKIRKMIANMASSEAAEKAGCSRLSTASPRLRVMAWRVSQPASIGASSTSRIEMSMSWIGMGTEYWAANTPIHSGTAATASRKLAPTMTVASSTSPRARPV